MRLRTERKDIMRLRGLTVCFLCLSQLISAASIDRRRESSYAPAVRVRGNALPAASAAANEQTPPGANTGAGGGAVIGTNGTDISPADPQDPGERTHTTSQTQTTSPITSPTTTSSSHSHFAPLPLFTITTPHINSHSHSRTVPVFAPTSTPTTSSSSSSSSVSPAALIFEIIGGLLGFAIILSIIRCVYKYRRTPALDRVAVVIDRHHLDRELAEMAESNNRASLFGRLGISTAPRASVSDPPPPPYMNAPEYDTVVAQGHDRENGARTDSPSYAEHESTPIDTEHSGTPVPDLLRESEAQDALLHAHQNSS